MKVIEKNKVIIDPRKKVEVIATEKHPAKTGSVILVPEHMVPHLLKNGMIEDPKKKGK
jgi:hypothetical protein